MSEELPEPETVEMETEAQRTAAVALTLQIVIQCMNDLERRISAIEDKVGIERVDMPEVTL